MCSLWALTFSPISALGVVYNYQTFLKIRTMIGLMENHPHPTPNPSKCLINWVNDLQFLTRILTKFLKGFYWPKRDEKMYKRVPIFRCTTPSTGKRLKEFEVVVGTLYSIMYQRRLQIPLISSLLMVLYTEISELFCTSFRLALVNKILLKTNVWY